jgi:hypothetical protein
MLDRLWTALTDGDDDVLCPPVVVSGRLGYLRSQFAVEAIAVGCIATALRAAVALDPQRWSAPIELERRHIAEICRSERYFSVDGAAAPAGFAPLSRFWPAADGWVRTHANYPWHQRALLDALGIDEPAAEAVGEAITSLGADEFEDRVFAAGGVGAAVRSFGVWSRHPQGRAVAKEPLVSCDVLGNAPARPVGSRPRVLDLTRVIAGPVSTRLLGALGADVLRIDPPRRRDMAPGTYADTLLAKRSATLDLATPDGLKRLHALLHSADVVVQGYRPGALGRFGLSAEEIAARHPGTVIVVIDAWGHDGPWAPRRGFDSVVQAATGLAAGEVQAGGEPGSLPCQLLDHGTGYLAAAAALDGLRRQRRRGGTIVRRVSLARTAWLIASTPSEPGSEVALDDKANKRLTQLRADGHTITAVSPPGTLAGEPLCWPHAGRGYGADSAVWEQ